MRKAISFSCLNECYKANEQESTGPCTGLCVKMDLKDAPEMGSLVTINDLAKTFVELRPILYSNDFNPIDRQRIFDLFKRLVGSELVSSHLM
jgi:hypothetical protein